MSSEEWRSEFKRLWKELVPPQGQASTVQGELIRALGRLSDEAFRNGNLNFDKNHRLLCRFVRQTLKDPSVFSPVELTEIDTCVGRILNAKEPDVSGQSTSFHRVIPLAVRWCKAHPAPIPRELNSALRI